MAINDKKGINLTSGFKYVGGQPLDVRLVAEDESDLQSLVDNGATYNGMVVWVNSTSKRMVFNGSEFIEDVSPDTIGNINDVLEQINGGGTSSGGSSSGGSSSSGSSITKVEVSATIGATTDDGTLLNIVSGSLVDLYECDIISLHWVVEESGLDYKSVVYKKGTQQDVYMMTFHHPLLEQADVIVGYMFGTSIIDMGSLALQENNPITFTGYKFN